MKTYLNNDSTIQIHFNDVMNPTEMTFATYIDSKLVVLRDEHADRNDIEDVAELAGCTIDDAKESREESLYLYFFEVKNANIGTPFTDSDIPEHFFKLGILNEKTPA